MSADQKARQSWSRSGDMWDPQDCEDGPGHEWAPAGGGLLVCIQCESERWDNDDIFEGRADHYGGL